MISQETVGRSRPAEPMHQVGPPPGAEAPGRAERDPMFRRAWPRSRTGSSAVRKRCSSPGTSQAFSSSLLAGGGDRTRGLPDGNRVLVPLSYACTSMGQGSLVRPEVGQRCDRWPRLESNQRPPAYQTGALPLRYSASSSVRSRRETLMEPGGIEPPPSGCEPGALPIELRSRDGPGGGLRTPGRPAFNRLLYLLSYSRTMYRAGVEPASEDWKSPTSPPMLPVRVIPTGGIEPPFPG